MITNSKNSILDYLLVSIMALSIICISSQVWNLDLNVLPSIGGDKMLGTMLYKSIDDYGLKGMWFNPSINAPEGASLIDTPFIDYPMYFLAWMILKVVPSASAVSYIIYFMSYPLAAISMLFLLNRYSQNRYLNIIMSVAFSIVPYHFLRGSIHSTLSCYYAIPIGIYLALMVFHEDFEKGVPKCLKSNLWRKIFFWFAVLYVGLSNVYYSFFTMLIILVSIVYKIIGKKSFKPILQEGRVFFVMACAFIMGILPKIIYGIMYGKNTVAIARPAFETELYSLKIIQLLMPPSYTRVGFLNRISEKYNSTGININENTCSSLGIISIIGFVILCMWVIVRLVQSISISNKIDLSMNALGCYALVLILYCVPGGFGTIFSYVVTSELRALNRVSIVLNAICILAVVLILNKIRFDRLVNIFVSILLVISIYAEVPVLSQNDYQISSETDSDYKNFFKLVQESNEKKSMIYQLPMSPFPEAGYVNRMDDYSLFLGYTYTDDLRWSYGGGYGRNDQALRLYIDNGMSNKFLSQIIDFGYTGIYIDTYGYKDEGKVINNYYGKILGLNQIVSADKRLYYYSLDKLDESKLKIADDYYKRTVIDEQFSGLYYQLNGIELTDDLCISLIQGCKDKIDYSQVYDKFFDNIVVDQISNERYAKGLYSGLLKRDGTKEEIESVCNNLQNAYTKKDVFIQFCNTQEFQKIVNNLF